MDGVNGTAKTALAFILAAALAADAGEPPAFPLGVSGNHRHLVDQQGKPFFYHADTAWMLFIRLTGPEAAEYLAARRAQGFNAVQVMLTGFLGDLNREGEPPFLGAPGNPDFSRPNERFFAHIDRVLSEAGRQGMLLAVAPLWSGCCGEGWAGQDRDGRLKPINLNGVEKCRAFGRWLGRRYVRFDNILWILGGDNDPHESLEHIRALGLGLKESAPHQLITHHPASSHSSTDVWPAEEPWLDVSMVYTYFRGFDKAWNKDQPDVYEISHREYLRTPTRPFFLGESTYEGEHGEWGSALQVRKQAYWCALGGGCGHAYGSPNWKLPDNWRDVLNLPGAESLKHLRVLMESRSWWFLVPDLANTIVINGLGTDASNDDTVAATAEDGSFALVYVPEPRPLTVDLRRLAGDAVDISWFDPSGGVMSFTGSFDKNCLPHIAPPVKSDYLLILDAR